MDTNLRFQVAAVCVLICILVDYIRNSQLKLFSTKCFKLLLGTSTASIFFDMFRVYSMMQNSKFEVLWNKLYYISIALVAAINFLYLWVLSREQKRITGSRLIIYLLPLFAVIVFMIFNPVECSYKLNGIYVEGAPVVVTYIAVLLYAIVAFVATFLPDVVLTGLDLICMRCVIAFWALTVVGQINLKGCAILSFAMILYDLYIYFSFETHRENYDVQTECFNERAFDKMLSELYENGKKLYLVNVVCENYDSINVLLGRDKSLDALAYIEDIVEMYTLSDIYHSRMDIFSFFITDDNNESMKQVDRIAYALDNSEFKEAKLVCSVNMMDIKKYTKSKNEVYDLMGFMADMRGNKRDKIMQLDEDIVAKKERRDKIEHILLHAIENDGFVMNYQPIYWPEEGKFKSAEALVRLKDNTELGYISPEEFIPIAEEKQLIIDIGNVVASQVAQFIRFNQLQDTDLEYIEINISGIQAVSPDISNQLYSIFTTHKIKPSFINLEITETATINSKNLLDMNMEKLRNMGFSFSMDDFGTGYSNLSQMTQINYDLVKIDKSLIWPVFFDKNKKAEKLLVSVIKMLKLIGVKIVAEGVETEEMADYLIKLGVEHLQGYYYSRPINEEKYLQFLQEKSF